MKKIKNLDELETLVGRDAIEKCFMEYMLTIIGRAKRLEDLQNRCAVMDEDEMADFVRRVGRSELFEEMKERPGKEPRYFRAVQATLMALGYDERWVYAELDEEMNKEYFTK